MEDFTADERARLRPHFSSLDAPVFALTNLPETTKAALFARYSRYPGTLRRLFLDEFADDVEPPASAPGEGARAARLMDRVFVGYGDDSVAQLGGAHVACEDVSNVLTKVLERPRLGAFLEQSTRYIAYDARPYRYHRDPALGPDYAAAMDALFDAYARMLPRVEAWVGERFDGPAGAVRAKALDLVRGVLPAASLAHVGIFGSGQLYESLILHLLAHPLPEAQRCGAGLLEAVQAVIPSFVARVGRPDRGGAWIDYLRRRAEAASAHAPAADGAPAGPSVRLLRAHGTEDDALAALLFEAAGVGEAAVRAALEGVDRAALFAALVGDRANRRHRPGRGLETLHYRFEIVSDYGAFRDLQRHRLLTVQWQRLTPDLGADVPPELDAAGVGDDYRRALARSAAAYAAIEGPAAQYAVCLGFRIRYVLELNAREAMHLIELRSQREGHPSYRAIAHELQRQIATVHPHVAAAMTHVDPSVEPRLERLLAERRARPS